MSGHSSSSHSRSLPDRPSLRFLKLEARERLAAGEFGTLHDAQLAIAREHGLPSWAALKQLIASQAGPDDHALEQVRWVISRFAGADGPGWAAPAEAELTGHLDPRFLAQVKPARLTDVLSRRAAMLREELVVLAATPLLVRAQADGMQIEAAAAPEPPYRLTMLRVFPVGGKVSDARVTTPVSRVSGEVPGVAAEIAETAFGELGLAGLVVAGSAPTGTALAGTGPTGTALAGTGPTGTGPTGTALASRGWVAARGWADLDEARALRPETKFPAWSVTKLVTAIAVLRLAAGGQVGLDDSANRYLGPVKLADDGVTVRELLAHTGGVDSPAALFAETVPEQANLTGPVLACSGERGVFGYSNGGYAALGALIAEVTGTDYAAAATGLVLAPLGMTSGSFPGQWPGEDGLTGYRLDADDGTFEPAPRQVCTIPAAGGLWATAGDLVRLGAGWRSLLPDELAGEALTPQADRTPAVGQMGLGWVLNTDRGVAGHHGAGPGGSASLITKGEVVAVALTSRMVPIEPVAARVIRAVA